MPTQQQIDAALKAGYTMEQIDKELATPGSVKRVDALGTPQYEQMTGGQYASAATTPPRPQDVGQTSTGTNAQGETIYNFGIPQAPTNVPAPAPTTTVAQPGSVSGILGDMGDNQFTTDYYNRILQEYNAPIDEQAIYEKKRQENQAQIDAINALYADRLRQEKQTSQGRLGSSRAIQARSGLIGSDFGTAQTSGVQQLNREQEQSVENERLALVNQILSGAQKSAADEIAAKRKARDEGGKAYLDYLAGQQTRKQENTSKAAQLLLLNNKTPEDITDAELSQAKISRNDLRLVYSGLKSQQESEAAKAKAEQEKAALEALKTQSEIDKNEAAIITEALKTGRVYESGGFIFDGATNELIGNAQAVTRARASGGGGGGGSRGVGIAGYINPTGKASIDLQQVELPSKATEFSKKSYGFGVRMAEAEESIGAIENLYKTTGTTKEFITSILPSFLQSAERQKFEQAKRNFVNSVLRNESGAVITESEFKNAEKQYFPQPGDTPEVLEQKKRNRDTAASNMFTSAGKDAYGNSLKDIYNAVRTQNQQTPPPQNNAPSGEDAYAQYLKSIGQ